MRYGFDVTHTLADITGDGRLVNNEIITHYRFKHDNPLFNPHSPQKTDDWTEYAFGDVKPPRAFLYYSEYLPFASTYAAYLDVLYGDAPKYDARPGLIVVFKPTAPILYIDRTEEWLANQAYRIVCHSQEYAGNIAQSFSHEIKYGFSMQAAQDAVSHWFFRGGQG